MLLTRHFKRRLGMVLAPLTLITSAALIPVTAAPAEAASTWLPFEMPSAATLRSSPKKVFANWVPSLPISIDNKAPSSDYYAVNYLRPSGENSKHAAYGGFLRDRPMGRAPLAGSDWKLQDMKTEVRNAIAAGIDGFTVVIYSFPSTGQTNAQWTNIRLMAQAAAEVGGGFSIIPMPDMTSSVKDASIDLMATRINELSKFSSVHRIDGKMVFSPFVAERKSVAHWSSVLSALSAKGSPVTFWPLFLDEQTYGPAFSAISYGMANWGNRDPGHNNPAITYATGPIGRVATVKARGDKWMQPVSVQDERPREGNYWEAGNTQNLRNTWEIARKTNSDWVQLTTWNDLPEGSGILPSANHGFTFLDIDAYYINWFKTGVAPKITRDAIYLTHRKQLRSAKVQYPQSKWMSNLKGGTAGRDNVEALVFSQSAGTVSITTGGRTTSCAVDAGIDTCTVPAGNGAVSAKLVRGSTQVASLTSPYPVSASPYIQDFEYTGSSSLRSGTSASLPVAQPATGSTVTVIPTEDTFVNQAVPAKNYGGGPSMLADGTPAMQSFMKFNLPAAPSGKTLTGATLRVRTTPESFAGSPGTFDVKLAGNGWAEKTVTWNNRPAATSGVLGTFRPVAVNTAYTAGLSAATVKPLLGQQATLLVSTANADGVFFDSISNGVAADRPQLTLTFA